MKNVLMNDEARAKLIAGVNLAADVAAVTYGPNGHTVISGDHITKDGMTAVSWIYDPDPFIMMGVNLMKEIAKRSSEVAGDGSTTSEILAREVVNTCTKEDIPILKDGLTKTIEFLKQNRRFISSKEDLKTIATIAANGDSLIGELVSEAFHKVGDDGIVAFTESEDSVEDYISYTNGFRVDNGYTSSGFVNTPQNTCELNNVFVYISDTKLEEAAKIADIANECVKKGKSLLLIAPEFDSEIYVFLQSNLNLLKSCCVISPAFKKQRTILVQDIKILLGEQSYCDKVIVTKKDTTFIQNKKFPEIAPRVEEIKNIINNGNLKESELDFHKKRLANFTSGIATIYVGGYSQFEIKEKLDRIEDAVRAADCALKEGILAGAGSSLYEAAKSLPSEYDKFSYIVNTPYRLLNGIDNMNTAFEKNIIEPYLVTATALENSINIATTILTCDCAIVQPKNY